MLVKLSEIRYVLFLHNSVYKYLIMKYLSLIFLLLNLPGNTICQTAPIQDIENLPVVITTDRDTAFFGPQIVGFPINIAPDNLLGKKPGVLKGRVEAMSGFVTGCNLVYCTASTAKIRLASKTDKEDYAYVVFRNTRSAVILGDEVKLSVHYFKPEDFDRYFYIYNEFETDMPFLLVEE